MRRPVLALVALSTVLAVLAPVQAEASTTFSRVHASVTHTSMTVTLKSLGSGWRYRLYASTAKPDVYSGNLTNGRARHSALASRPRMSISSMTYTTKVYWYKILATKGSSKRYSPIYSVSLTPNVPSQVAVTSNSGQGTSVTWVNGAVTGLSVQRADDAAFTTNVVSYSLRHNSQQLSPFGLVNGATYYFRVRAMNGSTGSAYSAAVSTTAQSNEQSVRVGTYNLNNAQSGAPAASWSQRRVAGASLVNEAAPDLLGVQEASNWVSKSSHNYVTGVSCPATTAWRQVDDFVAALGGTYQLAPTEIAPCSGPGWFRGANYILYNPRTYTVVDAGHFVIDTINGVEKWAPWAVMQNIATGARLLFVAPHITVDMSSPNINWDQRRQTETTSLIQQAQQVAANNGNLPIVYAGDFNSNSKHTLDGPAVAMRAAHNEDAEYGAQSLTNFKYDSANKYMRTPPAFSDDIDHVFMAPGVSPRGWKLWMHMSNGQLVGTIPSDHNLLTADVNFPY